MGARAKVVIVGGGIGGAALAGALARGGVEVAVLEATTAYEDRVRGKNMQAWGVAARRRRSASRPALLAAGAHIAPAWKTIGADGSRGHGDPDVDHGARRRRAR